MLFFFFFKQKTAYEMRISDWSSDVCSSDLRTVARRRVEHGTAGRGVLRRFPQPHRTQADAPAVPGRGHADDAGRRRQGARKSVVEGKSVSVRGDLGGSRIIKKKNQTCKER